MLGGRIDCWNTSVNTADVKKAEGASIWALRISCSPFLTGKEAWVHWSSLRSTLRIADRAVLRELSNCARRGLSLQSEVLSVYCCCQTDLVLFVCSACAANCKSCTGQGPAKCDTCNDGYYLTTSKTCSGHNFISLV